MIVAEELMIILVICFTSIIQSLFGVGVLVFGTPLLLILGLDFIQTLNILLPISLAINLFQFINNTKSLDSKLVKDFGYYRTTNNINNSFFRRTIFKV